MALLLSLFSGGVPAKGGLAPDLSIAQSSHDFGNVFVGEEVEHTFLIRNNGVKPIELRQRVAVGQSLPVDGDRDLRRAGCAGEFYRRLHSRDACPAGGPELMCAY